jgi:hypothetical protein
MFHLKKEGLPKVTNESVQEDVIVFFVDDELKMEFKIYCNVILCMSDYYSEVLLFLKNNKIMLPLDR